MIEETSIERGPEWRAYTSEEREAKARTVAPITPLLHDKGLTTELDWRDRNAYREALTPERRARMRRLRG